MKICIFSGSMSEYGLLKRLIFLLKRDKSFNHKVIISGSHLSKKYGYTIKEILNDGFEIYKKISTYDDNESDKCKELTQTIEKLYAAISEDDLDKDGVVW